MKRGDIVIIQASGTPASKARPCVLVGRDMPVALTKITICPLTSQLSDSALIRPRVMPTSDNGLNEVSEVEADWVFTVPLEKVRSRVGAVSARTMTLIDAALRLWLDL